MEKHWKQWLTLIFWAPKITADGDYRHEIERHLLTPWKESYDQPKQQRHYFVNILKSRDITLSIKVHLVKAMVFPVAMYGCEIWIIKKAECRRTDAFEL